MRLLDTKTLELREFFMSDVPPYAILSHTWSDDEVTFQEMSSPTRSSKKGFDKIAKTCRLARWDGVDFAWVDTCCIDKSSSAELSEAINSMYQWYLNADYCYIYLEDLDPNLPTNARPEEWLPHCRWLTRGWTLQELLAPKIAKNVKFFDMDWRYRGTKLNLGDALSEYTGIPLSVLTGGIAPSRYSVASRMSWAARRRTTRLEDTAYCLLGLFDVNMPLLYGEGTKAFRRL
ncbi:HET-domain-containing protein, partial [Stipitochalara longipes BDJ]